MRLATKYTYIYRLVGIIGCLLVIGSIWMPWVTLNTGELQDFQEGDSPTGWQLANLEKGGDWDTNIFAYLFMIVYVFLILAPIGIIIILIGKDARSIGYYLVSMAVFFLILVLFMMPLIQESIPIPENPYDALSEDEIDQLSDAKKAALDEQVAHRDRILNMKKIKIGPAIGVILTVIGGVVTYIGSRLTLRDSERVADMYKYYILLKEAHKSGRITKEEEDLLSAQRRMFRISREEHEMLLKKMFPDEREFQNAVYQHDNPVDMDRLIVEKSLQDYEVFLTQAYSHGEPTKEELQMLECIRHTLSISMDDHFMVLDYLRAEGRIREKPRRPSKKAERLAEVPEEVLPAADQTPRYVQSWEYKSTITREEPIQADTEEGPRRAAREGKPVPARKAQTKEIGEPIAAPPKVSGVPRPDAKEASQPPPGPAKPAERPPEKETPKLERKETRQEEASQRPKAKRPSKVKCTKCGATIPVPKSDGPVTIKCPGCGITGKI